MQSTLVVGGNLKDRSAQIKKLVTASDRSEYSSQNLKNHPDILFIESEKAISINLIRSLKRSLALKPFSAQGKIAIIPQAEKLTFPAQNAMLKLLEEPPQNCLIFLSTPSKKHLLPTIVSRCRLIHLQEQPEIELDKEALTDQVTRLSSFLTSSPGKKIILADEIAQQGREEAILFCQHLVFASRYLLLQNFKIKPQFFLSRQLAEKDPKFPKPPKTLSSLPILFILRLLFATQKALKYLQANVNPKLALEHLFLSLPTVNDKI